MEPRLLLAIDLSGVADWIELGSRPITEAVPAVPNGPSSGGVEDVAIDPNDPSHMFAATINGGIWRTHDGSRPFNGVDDGGAAIVPDDPGEQPSWTPVTDQYPSLAMGGIAFDPLDVTGNTVFAGTGSTSSLGNVGGEPIGIMKTTNDGESWSVYPLVPGGNQLRVRTVVPTTYDASADPGIQQVVLVGTSSPKGLYRSIDGGETYTQITDAWVGLPGGAVTDITGDPNDNSVFYAGVVRKGVFRSDDGGANWTDVNNEDLSTNASLGDATAVMLTAHASGGSTRLYAMVSYDDDQTPAADVPQVFRSDDDGTTWTELATVPNGFASTSGERYGTSASDQIIVDPSDEEIVYIAQGYGDSPMVYRYDPGGGGGWVQIEAVPAVGNTAPHVDHRDLQFVNSGGNDVLIDANDGGVYFLVDPQNTPGEWTGLHGSGATGLGTTEYTNVTWDSQFDVAFGGAQDNGTSVQTAPGSHVWKLFRGSDGGDVQAADAGGGNSYRYSATQPLAGNPKQSPIMRHEFSSPTTEVGAPVSLFPLAGLPDFNPLFVAQFELNSVNPSRLVVSGSGSKPIYELTNADAATGEGDANWVAVPTGPGLTFVNSNRDASFVVGGRLGGVDNEEVLIVGSGEDIIIRSTAGGTLTVTPTPFPGGKVEAIATDPENWHHLFVADSDRVWETTDAGSVWTEVTRNLSNVNVRLQSLAYVPTAEGDVIVLGGGLGVSRLTIGEPAAQWTRLGGNLPNASVNDLEYHANDDVLVAGTYGRGAWLIENASTVVDDEGVLTVCGDNDHVNQDDVFQIVRNALNPLILDVFVNSLAPVFSMPLAALSQINVFGQGGNDNLIVDSGNGLINVPSGIRYDGDGVCGSQGFALPPGYDRGVDTLTLTQTDGPAITRDMLSVGALPGTGVSILETDTGNTQRVYFEELEPIVNGVPAPTFSINGGTVGSLINESNAINYAPSNLFGATWGMVTVDAFEPVHFTNKDNLTIDAGAGNDSISLNNSNVPTGLTQINLNGGDPTAGSDTVTVNGTAALDTIVVDEFTNDGARIVGAQPATVVIDTAEHLQIVGQGGDDALTVTTPAGETLIDLTDGLISDAATIEMRQVNGGALLPVEFRGLGSDGSLTFSDSLPSRQDTLVFNAGDPANTGAIFRVDGNGTIDLASGFLPFTVRELVPVMTPGVGVLRLHGFADDDRFIIYGDHPFIQLSVQGGDGDNDVLDFLGSSNDVTIDARVKRITETGFAPVDFSGIEVVNTDILVAALLVEGSTGKDTINVTPRTPDNDGTFDHSAAPGVLFNYLQAASVTFDGDGDAADVLNVIGDESDNTIIVTGMDISVDGSTVTVGDGIEAVDIQSLDGSDDIDLWASTIPVTVTVAAGADSDNVHGTTRSPDNTVNSTTATPLILLGGPGSDALVGGSATDVLEGGDGDDLLQGAQGADLFFGGDGSDSLVWFAGDGSDLIEGGAGHTDQLIFIANDGDQVLQLHGGGLSTDDPAGIFPPQTLQNSTRAIFELNAGQVFLNTGDVESVYIDAMGGDDNIVINNQTDALSGGDSPNAPANPITRGTDLAATAVQSVELLPGLGDDYVEVHGTAGDDNLDTDAQGGAVTVEGASVLMEIHGSTGDDDLHLHGQGGNDNIKAADGVEALIGITLEGDAGDDVLSADAILIGGAGDDFLRGGAGDDLFFAGAGEDTMIGGDGQDSYDGGPGFDTIQISGTSAADDIDVRQLNATTLVYLVRDEFGNVIEDATTGSNTEDTIADVEQATVLAGEGSDTIFLSVRDELFDDPGASLRMAVDGGDDAAADRLGVLDHSDPDFNALPDLSILRQNHDITSGTVEIGPANAEPFLHVFNGIEFIQVVSDFPSTGQLFNVESPGLPNRLVVFKHDASEHNNDRNNATHLGANTTVNLDPTIDPGPGLLDLPADTDWYRVEALESGTIDFQVVFEQVASVGTRPGLPAGGDLNVNAFDSSGAPIANFTTSDDNDDNERVRIPAVQGEIYYFQVEGDGDATNAYDVTAINLPSAVPFDLELLDNPVDGTTNPPGTSGNSDTGRSQLDNVTYDATPTIVLRLDDGLLLNDLPGNDTPGTPLGDDPITIPFRAGLAQPSQPGYAIAVFDEAATAPAAGNNGGLNIRQPLGFATQIEPGLYEFTVPDGLELSEGSHFLTARVQMIDPADPRVTGFGERSLSLEILVDRTEPPVVFGLAADATDGLHPNSDSGDPSDPSTFIDRITNVEAPTFFGRAEANSIVRLYLDLDGDNILDGDDRLIGQTTATPLDGTEQLEAPQLPNEPGGEWEITSTMNMNDPAVLAELGRVKDGLRTILLSAEDLAGNITPPDQNETLNIFTDTQGPQVTDVFITGREDFDLFAFKPETAEPTPRVDSLTVTVRDLPPRIAVFLYDAISNVPPLSPIVLVGDHSGPIAIDNLFYDSISDGPGIAFGEIVLEFDEPLPDDRFTLTVHDNVIDPAGNRLDGENNATEPLDPFFPTGDAIPGGGFIARFTVDSRPEVATWSQGVVYADINGNFVWDPAGQDNDFTNRDFVYNFGEITDAYFVGNFALNDGASSGFDKLGAYGRFNGVYQFLLDTDDDGVGDIVPNMFYQVNAIPVAGNFFGPEGNALTPGVRPRDEIGAYDGNNWYLDVNGNNQIDSGEQFPTNMLGVPFVGDFNGDGFDDLAVFNNENGQFQFDLDRDGNSDNTINFGFPGFGEKPVAGDFNLDGIDDIGLWVPGQEGQLPKESGEFHFLLSDNDPIGGPTANPITNIGPNAIFDLFSPEPLGNDLISFFGDEFALPLWGNLDPPVGSSGRGATFVGSLTNPENPLDVNHDENVTSLDALVVINALGRPNLTDFSHPLRVVASLGGYQMDASQDGMITSGDALYVINALGQLPPVGAEAEQVSWADSVAAAFADDDDDDELLELLTEDRGTF